MVDVPALLNICGGSRLNNYTDTLTKEDLAKVTKREKLTSFKFG